VLVAAGAGAFWWVDAVDQQAVRLVGGRTATAPRCPACLSTGIC
jgi:hypothetical protein